MISIRGPRIRRILGARASKGSKRGQSPVKVCAGRFCWSTRGHFCIAPAIQQLCLTLTVHRWHARC